MPNRRRGEVPLALGEERYVLCLTLGALAELEDAFGVADLPALGERLGGGRLSGRDLLKLLAVGLRGGGHSLSDAEVAAMPLAGSLDAAAEAIGDMLVAAFGAAEPAQEGRSANPPAPRNV
jgi:hypothetical protein